MRRRWGGNLIRLLLFIFIRILPLMGLWSSAKVELRYSLIKHIYMTPSEAEASKQAEEEYMPRQEDAVVAVAETQEGPS